jgi:DNA-binding TFAR19-related protein (PDSD5 family)
VEYHAIETENAVLRNRLKDIKAASKDLVDAVEKYLRQGCLRSELIIKKDNLKNILK